MSGLKKRLLASNVSGAFRPPSYDAPLITTLVPQRAIGSSTPTYTGATTKYQQDFEGKLNLALSGEARFQGARREQNIWPTASENASGWESYTNITRNSTGFLETVDNGDHYLGKDTNQIAIIGVAGGTFVIRAEMLGVGRSWGAIRFYDGTGHGYYFGLTGAGSVGQSLGSKASAPGIRLLANGNYLVTIKVTNVTGGGVGYVLFHSASADGTMSFAGDIAKGMNVTKVHVANVTGVTNQNPSEYVSVGVLSAPYHGANVDGVKYFNTLNGNTVSSNVVTEATGAAIRASEAACAGGVTAGVVD